MKCLHIVTHLPCLEIKRDNKSNNKVLRGRGVTSQFDDVVKMRHPFSSDGWGEYTSVLCFVYDFRRA